jgi:hypothetical protein
MNSYVSEGKIIPYLNAGSAIASGDVVVHSGVCVGIAMADIAASTGEGNILVEGVVDVVKSGGTGVTFAKGARVYWSGSAAVSTASTNTLMGFATQAAADDDTSVRVKLCPLGDSDPLNLSQAAVVAALAGTLTGSVDGTLADVAEIALSTSDTYTDAAVNTAVNTAITSTNLQLKEIQTQLNAVISALKTANLMASA